MWEATRPEVWSTAGRGIVLGVLEEGGGGWGAGGGGWGVCGGRGGGEVTCAGRGSGARRRPRGGEGGRRRDLYLLRDGDRRRARWRRGDFPVGFRVLIAVDEHGRREHGWVGRVNWSGFTTVG